MKKLLALIGMALVASLSMASPAPADDAKFRCNGTFVGQTFDEVIVPSGTASKPKTCILIDSTVREDVTVGRAAYFEAVNTRIGDDVWSFGAQTVFVRAASTVGGNIGTFRTNQVLVYDSTVNGGIGVARTSQVNGQINICGNTINGAGIGVVESGTDILIGSSDPGTGCRGNTVTNGSVFVADNFMDVELVIESNSVPRGNMRVLDNEGPSFAPKLVRNNTGGRTLSCFENDPPFTGSPNPGWQSYRGQCGP